ncbi:MAG: hypothetical protein LC748_16895, partial [Thermomicrobia bacterium]|nr:hypothetical protein [Thermomicrobia bacterium]
MSTTTVERQRGTGRFATLRRWSPSTTKAKAGTSLLLCLLALATVAMLFQVPYRHTISIGAPDSAATVRGFFDPEGKGGFTY